MALKQFGNRKCLSFVSGTVQHILSHVVSEMEKLVIRSVSAVIDQMLFCHTQATAVRHISNT
jgi:hypothetical protein